MNSLTVLLLFYFLTFFKYSLLKWTQLLCCWLPKTTLTVLAINKTAAKRSVPIFFFSNIFFRLHWFNCKNERFVMINDFVRKKKSVYKDEQWSMQLLNISTNMNSNFSIKFLDNSLFDILPPVICSLNSICKPVNIS